MKRKLTAAIAALLAACMLCSCGSDGGTPQESGTEAETSVENTDSAGAGDESAEEVPADDLTGIDSEAALEEIRDTLADFSDFSYMYLYCKEYGDDGMLDENDTFMNDGYEYYRAVGGDFETYSELMSAIDGFCTEKVSAELGLKGVYYSKGENDELYIWKDADSGGGLLGFDIAYIVSADFGGSSVTLHCRAEGDGEYWEYPDGKDVVEDFDITMARFDNVWKISGCGIPERDFLTWVFNPDYGGEEY